MTQFLRRALRLWTGVEWVAESLIVLTTLGMIAAAMAQIVSRYAFNAPLSWSEELSRFLFVWLSFLATWLAWRRREHIGVQLLPARLLKWLQRPVEILILLFAVVSMYYGLRLLGLSMRQPSPALGIPMACVYAGYYVGILLVIGETLAGWVRNALGAAP